MQRADHAVSSGLPPRARRPWRREAQNTRDIGILSLAGALNETRFSCVEAPPSATREGVLRRFGIVLALAALFVGCDDGVTRTDSRFATPERTVATLFEAYGIADASQEAVRQRIGTHGAFELRDRAAFEQCFRDLDAPGGEGMAGYVLGLLAAAKDELRYETVEGRGYVIPREGVRVVMDRDETGAYRIVLAESVPEEIRRSLLQVEDNAQRRAPR